MEEQVDLLDFVQNKMKMTYYYQPVVIKTLLQHGGRAPRDVLAVELLLGDPDTLPDARRTLQRWPWETLRRRGVVARAHSSSDWVLTADYEPSDVPRILDACDVALSAWAKRFPQKQASQRIRLISAAEGCCQACGARPPKVELDIDHIVPRARAKNGCVPQPGGGLMSVDDERNLQVLCAPCNRGKRDQGDFDFRPSAEHLAKALARTLDIAARHGYDIDLVFSQGRAIHLTTFHEHVPSPLDSVQTITVGKP